MRILLRVLLFVAVIVYLYGPSRSWLRRRLEHDLIRTGRSVLNNLPSPVEHPASGSEHHGPDGDNYLPRHDLTPGTVDPRVTQANIDQTICRKGYTRTVRPPVSFTNPLKHKLMRAYGVRGNSHDYELDHLIPLSLGGCPDCETNLWPEPWNGPHGAHVKDQVEVYLQHTVCSGRIPLAKAQKNIAEDWYRVYQTMH